MPQLLILYYYLKPQEQNRKLKSCYGARNQFQEPSLALSSQAKYRLAGWYDNPMPTWFLAPIAGLKLPTQRAHNDTKPARRTKTKKMSQYLIICYHFSLYLHSQEQIARNGPKPSSIPKTTKMSLYSLLPFFLYGCNHKSREHTQWP
jgi:hypothetical protein